MAKTVFSKLSGSVQESLLALLAFDSVAGKAVRAMVPLTAFDPYQKEIAKEVCEYIDKYNIPPGEHLIDLVSGLASRSPDRETQYLTTLQVLEEMKGKVNKEYVLGNAKTFARKQRAKAVVDKVISLLKQDSDGCVDEIDALFAATTKNHTDLSDPGVLFNDSSQALRFLNDDALETMPTGIPEFDKFRIGPARKRYLLIESETSVGKSQFAVHLGKTLLMAGYRVLHVTLEMSEDEVAQRYIQSFFSVSLREAKINSTKFKKDSLGRVAEFLDNQLTRPTLKDENIRSLLIKKLKPLAKKPKLYIKEFPSGTLTIPRFKAYLDHLEAVKNFQADCIICDYADLMEHSAKDKRNELGKIAVDLRGIAGARNLAMVSFSQVNEVKQGSVIKTGRSSEGRQKEHTADIILTLNQTDAEYELGLLRIFCAKNRGEKKNIKVLISQSLQNGQFLVDTALMAEDHYMNLLKQNGHKDESDDYD